MQPKMRGLLVSAAFASVMTARASIPVSAQQAPAPPARPATYPVAVVLSQIGQSAGVTILVDSTVQGRLPLPAVTATAATVEQQIGEMVRSLPAGTTWAKLYVPAPANGRWSGDVVANYARSLAQLVGTVGRSAPAGTVEILGRQIPTEKANDYIAALNLKLVYLVTNPRTQTAGATASNWWQMDPAQREQYVQQQAQRLLALDPATRVQMLHDLMQQQVITPQMALMKAVMSQLTDDERIQLKQSFVGDKSSTYK